MGEGGLSGVPATYGRTSGTSEDCETSIRNWDMQERELVEGYE